jgi:hypothetical protein
MCEKRWRSVEEGRRDPSYIRRTICKEYSEGVFSTLSLPRCKGSTLSDSPYLPRYLVDDEVRPVGHSV